MSGKPQSVIRRVSVGVTKDLRRRFLLVAADSDAHHVAVAVAQSKFEHITCRFRAKLAHSVKNPEHRNSEVTFCAFSSAFEPFENRGEIEFAPEAYTDGDIDLCVQSIFCLYTLHQTVRDQLVIFASLQIVANTL